MLTSYIYTAYKNVSFWTLNAVKSLKTLLLTETSIHQPAYQKAHKPRPHRHSERGNVFFTLFGAVAVVGVLGAGIMATMRGPLSTMVEVNLRERAKTEMSIAAKLIMLESTDSGLPNSGDCDLDGFIEPLEYAASIPSLTGGGTFPASISTRQDPWGQDYGYCVWDAGNTVDDAGCGGGTQTRLAGDGSTSEGYPIIVIVSAGPDGTFETSCGDLSGTQLNKAGDDLVQEYTYEYAVTATGGLWKIKSGTPTTATIDKDLEVTGGASFSNNVAMGATAQLQLGAASLLLPDQNAVATCNGANDQILRRNTGSGDSIVQICDFTGTTNDWVTVGSIGAIWTRGTGDDVYYNDGTPQVGIGTTSPDDTLDVVGTFDLSGAAAIGGLLTAEAGLTSTAGTTTLGTTNISGATAISNTLAVTNDVTITGSSNTGSGDSLRVNNSDSSRIFVVQHDGRVGIGDADPAEELDVAGDIVIEGAYMIDSYNVLASPNTTADTNIFVGNNAGNMGLTATVDGNTVVGAGAATGIDGANNTILGQGAGTTLTTGTNNILIGQGVDVPLNTTSNYLNIGGAITGSLTTNSIAIGGDLTISGDDLFMGTNTDGAILVADGSNFNPVVASGDATIANDGAITIADGAVDEGKLDMSNSATGGDCLKFISGALTWQACSGGGGGDGVGTDGFTDLADTPNAYAGAAADANKLVVVNATGDGLEFVDAATAAGEKDRIKDLTSPTDTYIDVDTTDDGLTNSTIFVNNGVESMRIAADGKIGIGNIVPTNAIQASIGANEYFIITDANDSNNLRVELGIDGSSHGRLMLRDNSESVGINLRSYSTSGFSSGVLAGGGSAATSFLDGSAILEARSTTKGFLAPRMTEAERDLIASPATGLLVFATDGGDAGIFQFYDGTNWIDVGAGGAEGGGLWTDLGGDRIHYGTTGTEQVGIGTNNPLATLDVNGGVRVGSVAGAAPSYMVLNSLANVDTTPANGECLAYNSVSTNWESAACGGAGTIADDGLDWDKFSDTMVLDATTTIDMTAGDLNFDANTFVIDSSADFVGIGTATPSSNLTIHETSNVPAILDISSAGPAVAIDLFTKRAAPTQQLGVLGTKGWTIAAAKDGFGGGLDNDMYITYTNGGTNNAYTFWDNSGNVLITDAGFDTPDNNAILELISSTRGFLPPRNTDPNANITGVAGLMAYDSTDNTLQYYNGTAWVSLAASGTVGDRIQDIGNNTHIDVDTAGDGSADSIVFTTNNATAMTIDSSGNIIVGTNGGSFSTDANNNLSISGGGSSSQSVGTRIEGSTIRSSLGGNVAYSAIANQSILATNGQNITGDMIGFDNSLLFQAVNASLSKIYGIKNSLDVGTVLAGSITNAYGYYGDNPTITGGTGPTNLYGIYLEDMTAGVTNNYAIYSAGGISYFADPIVIGAATPNVNAALDVNGTNLGFLPPRNTDPGANITGVAGLMAYDSTDNTLQYYNGTAWVTLSTASGVIALNDITDVFHDTTTDFDADTTNNDDNLFIGHLAASLTGTADPNKGARNTAIGATALDAVTEGDQNVAIGYDTLTALTTGTSNIAIGSSAANSITSALANIAIGTRALVTNDVGHRNVAVGGQALGGLSSSSSFQNTALGNDAGRWIRTGSQNNVFIGHAAAFGPADFNYSGDNNVIIGATAAQLLDNDNNQNTIIGADTAATLTGGGSGNILLGYGVDVSSTTSSNELNIGDVILGDLSTGRIGIGVADATAINANAALEVTGTNLGFLPPRNTDPAGNMTGVAGLIAYDSTDNQLQYYNGTAWVALTAATTPSLALNDLTDVFHDTTTDFNANTTNDDDNLFIGHLGASLTGTADPDKGARNTAIGATALDAVTEGDGNVAIGYDAGSALTTGFGNVFIGPSAGRLTSTGSSIVAVGNTAGRNIGNFSTVMGYEAGAFASGSSSTYIGYKSGRSAGAAAGSTALGLNTLAFVTGNNNVALGAGAALGVDGSSTAANSVFIGRDAGTAITTGNNNIFMGFQAGDAVTEGSNNILIGYDEDLSAVDADNELNIGGTIFGNLSTKQVGIGVTDATAINANAALEVTGTNLGFLPPRNTDPNANITGTAGLIAYDSTDNQLQYYNGTSWVALTAAAASDRIQDVGNNTSIDVDTVGDGSGDIIQFTNNTAETMRIAANGYIGINNPTPATRLDIHETTGGVSGNGGLSISHADQTKSVFIDLFTSRPDLTKELGADATTKGWGLTAIGNNVGSATYRNDFGIAYYNGTATTNWIMFDTTGSMLIKDSGALAHPNSKAILDLTSSTRGLLPPRNANPLGNITSPPAGLIAYDSTDNQLQYYNGSTWVALTASGTASDDDLTNNTLADLSNVSANGADTQLLVRDASTWNPVTLSGDATIANTGAITIANDAVTTAKIIDNAVTTAKIANATILPADVNAVAAATGTEDEYCLTYEHGTTNFQWQTCGGTPAGSNTQIQFNNSGVFGASSNLTWNGTTLAITGDMTFSGIVRDVSDRRLKTDITPLNASDIMTRLTQIDTYTFRMKADPAGRIEYGVMAQELEQLFPELVVTADDEMGTKSVNYMGLIAPMIEATKTLQNENAELKAQIDDIKTAQADMLNKVNALSVHTGYSVEKAAYDNWLMLAMMAMMGGIIGLLIRRKHA